MQQPGGGAASSLSPGVGPASADLRPQPRPVIPNMQRMLRPNMMARPSSQKVDTTAIMAQVEAAKSRIQRNLGKIPAKTVSILQFTIKHILVFTNHIAISYIL